MPFIRRLVWDPGNVAHVARHRVTVDEVEEVSRGEYVERQSYMLRVILIGPTNTGRVLTVILEDKGDGLSYVVTARPASRRERRFYQQETGGNGHA
jgi:hypothetical protein